MNLNQYLTEAESRYDAQCQMLGAQFHGPGYHSRVPEGTWTHATRESADYAIALLESGTEANRRRACLVIARILSLQERNSTAGTYGIWPWLLEESLAEMSPPDWNWADFIGARLVQILVQYGPDLPDSLRHDTRIALEHAAWSIFRRNVQSNYTNIAIMGAGVTVAAGEILAVPLLVDYGRRRLANMVAYVQDQGNFNEYNSPTYTTVAIHETERILQLVQDSASRAAAEWIRNFAWQTTLAHFHSQTCQWAPPHARAYHDHLPPETAAYLSTAARAAGFVIGFVGPHVVNQTGAQLVIDPDALAMTAAVTGANETDYHVTNFNWINHVEAQHRSKAQVADIRNVVEGDKSPGGSRLTLDKGIELGHVFKLGTKYSKALGAVYLDDKQQSQPMIMGCYGIGPGRIIVAALETLSDKDGIVWPVNIAPFEVLITPIRYEGQAKTVADELHAQLAARGVDVLLDDRDQRPGVKFKDGDLIGIPLRIVLGEKGLATGQVELKRRTSATPEMLPLENLADRLGKIIDEMRPKV